MTPRPLATLFKQDSHLTPVITEREELQTRLANLETTLEDALSEKFEVEKKLLQAQRLSEDRQIRIDDMAHKLAEVYGSRCWRMTAPIRFLARLARGDWNAIKKPFEDFIKRNGRPLYEAIPIREETKRHLAVSFLTFFRLYPGGYNLKAPASPCLVLPHVNDGPSLTELVDSIELPSCDKPVVSVIIPSHGKVAYTLRCLVSITRFLPKAAFEVIVAEDASCDPDLDFVRGIDNLRFIENSSNLGFLKNSNNAAKTAKGEYILFLNNDTQVTEGWLDAMLDIFRHYPDAGIVGSKLVYPDGRLQEAGGIIWSNGMASNYGRFDDPQRPEYNYVRECDYISGASLMVKAELFKDLQGFDEAYAPAYYEDTDLCFRARAQGMKTYYQPFSVIIHHEGISHGTDTSFGTKSYQVINRRVLRDRWKKTLEIENHRYNAVTFKARERALNRKTVLVMDRYMPRPDRDAGSRSMFCFIQVLLNAGYIVKFWPQNLSYDPDYTPQLQRMGVEVIYGLDYDNDGFGKWLEENGSYIDTILISRPEVANWCLKTINRLTKARLVYYGHDLHYRRLAMQAEITKSHIPLKQSAIIREIEENIWQSVDCVLYPSQEEADIVKQIHPDVAAIGVPGFAFHQRGEVDDKPERRSDIIFVASFNHRPNVDAVHWLVQDIMPLVWKERPDARVKLIGSSPTESVKALASDRVEVTGWIDDARLEDYYRHARIVAVPLRFGAGVKCKTVEALQWGTPMVTTSVGAQGLENLEQAALIRDDAKGFAEAILELLGSDKKWRETAASALEYAGERFSFATMQREVVAAIEGAETR